LWWRLLMEEMWCGWLAAGWCWRRRWGTAASGGECWRGGGGGGWIGRRLGSMDEDRLICFFFNVGEDLDRWMTSWNWKMRIAGL
jgi:hypothetical protein